MEAFTTFIRVLFVYSSALRRQSIIYIKLEKRNKIGVTVASMVAYQRLIYYVGSNDVLTRVWILLVKSRGQRLVLTLNRGQEIKSFHLWASIGRTTCTTKRKWRGLRRRWFVRLSAVTSGDVTNGSTFALQAWPASSKRACIFTRARRSTAYKTGVRAASFFPGRNSHISSTTRTWSEWRVNAGVPPTMLGSTRIISI